MTETQTPLAAAYQHSIILWRESLQLWRDRTIVLTLLIASALFAFAALTGMRVIEAHEHMLVNLETEDRGRFDALLRELEAIPPSEVGTSLLYTAADPVMAAKKAAEHALKPVAPFAFLSGAQSEQYPSSLRVQYDALELVNDRELFDNPELTMDGRFDVIFVVIVLAPLLVVIFSFNIISLEKELGVWRMSVAQPVPPSRLILAKLSTRLGWLSLILLGPLIVALAVAGRGWDDLQNWLMAVILIAGVFLYLCFWLLLTTLFNLLRSSSAANGIAAVFAWLLIVLALPALLQFTGRLIHPAPSLAALVAAEQATWDHTFSDGSRELERRREAAGFGSLNDADRDIPDEWSYLFVFHREFEEQMTPLYAQHDETERAIASWQNLTAWVSPATAISGLMESVSGGDYVRHAAFLAQARVFHRDFNAFFLPFVYSGDRLTLADYAVMPREFDWSEPSLAARLATPLSMLGALFLANGVMIVIGVLVYRRLETRTAF